MAYSKMGFLMMSKPKTGRLVSKRGSMAQCMAQATEVVIPNASQLSFLFMRTANIAYICNSVARNGLYYFLPSVYPEPSPELP